MNPDVRDDFPLLAQRDAQGRTLAYLDNAATTQKPLSVIQGMVDFYTTANANPHRGAYAMSERATEAYEAVRGKVAGFIHAESPNQVVFTGGTTDAINQVAAGLEFLHLQPGDEILLTVMEHHSNLLPWQRLAKKTGAALKFVPLAETGLLDMDQLDELITPRTKLAAIAHVSNVLGVTNPIRQIADRVHAQGGIILADGAQAIAHLTVDVQALDVDLYAFSAHKMYGPTGVGVLYGKPEILRQITPLRLGGGMVERVTFADAVFQEAPWKFEAGTPPVEGVIGLGLAVDCLMNLGMDSVQQEEKALCAYAMERLQGIAGLTLYGSLQAWQRGAIIPFNVTEVHPHDTATILAAFGVAIRAGHHCAQPLMSCLGAHAMCRASLSFYNTKEEIDRLADGLIQVRKVMGLDA